MIIIVKNSDIMRSIYHFCDPTTEFIILYFLYVFIPFFTLRRKKGTSSLIFFKIHQFAKTNEDPVSKAALRVIGHAVSAGHMKEHAMVASDYAVKVINLLHPDNMDAVKKERLWQIEHLKEINRH